MNASGNALTVGLFACNSLNVDNIFETVDGGDFALTALICASDDGNLVIFSDGNALDL